MFVVWYCEVGCLLFVVFGVCCALCDVCCLLFVDCCLLDVGFCLLLVVLLSYSLIVVPCFFFFLFRVV